MIKKKKDDRRGPSCNDCPYTSSVCNDVNKRSSHFQRLCTELCNRGLVHPWEVTLRNEQATAGQSEPASEQARKQASSI